MTEHYTQHETGSDPTLDRRLRDLGDRADHVAWVDSADVRRRGDHRRRVVTSTLAIAAAAVVGVGAVVATQVVDRPSAAPPATTTPSPSDTEPTQLADDPFLRPADLGVIGPYESFTRVPWEPWDSTESCQDRNESWRADIVETYSFSSDLDATFEQTVLLFEDQAGASRAATMAQMSGYSRYNCLSQLPGIRELGSRQQWVPLGDQSFRRSRLTAPVDGGLSYREVATIRMGTVVIILTWSSLGSPFEDPEAWVWDDARLTTALERAVADAS